MKKYLLWGISILIGTLAAFSTSYAFTTFITLQGGTGTSTPSGILYGDNGATTHLNTVTIGSGCTFITGTLTCAGTGATFGYLFPNNATTTTLTFSGGLVSQGSTTIAGLTSGLVGNSNGLFYGFASSSLFGYTPLNPTRNINTTSPLQGGGSLASDLTLSFSGVATSSPIVQGQVLYATGLNTEASVATSSIAVSAGLTNTGTFGAQVGGTALTLKQVENRGFSYATTTGWTGTTTISLGVGYGELWQNAKCYTDVGTLNVDFYHATTHFQFFNASTTIGTVNMANAADTIGDKVSVDIGTPASTPTKISCTVQDIN